MKTNNIIFYLLLLVIFSCSKNLNDEITIIDDTTLPIDRGQKIFTINIAKNFIIRDKFHVIMSDSVGNLLDSITYFPSKVDKELELYTKKDFTTTTNFSLTFIDDHKAYINNYDFFKSYNIFIYSNLNQQILGKEITLKNRIHSLTGGSIKAPIPFVKNKYILNTSGFGYSAVNSSNTLKGSFTHKFQDDLGSNKLFVKYYDPTSLDVNRIKYALIKGWDDNGYGRITELKESDFSSNGIELKYLTTNKPADTPILSIYGFENENFYEKLSGHNVYGSTLPPLWYGSNRYFYFHPNFFHETVFSLAFNNYSLFDVGLPPQTINVNDNSVTGSFTNNEISFNGLNNYEVGRATMDNYSNNIRIEFIFNGASKKITIPQIPKGIISENAENLINNKSLRFVQIAAENYSTFKNYSEYLQNVFKNSSPFYLTSPKRERVYRSYGYKKFIPIFEFPLYERFR